MDVISPLTSSAFAAQSTLFGDLFKKSSITKSSLSLTSIRKIEGPISITVAGDVPTTVALFYPTATPAVALTMGPWRPVVTPGAPVAAAPLKGLILISHGTGGHELGHHNLATRLAADGYLVAALRQAVSKAVQDPEYKHNVAARGVENLYVAPERLDAFFVSETKKWRDTALSIGIKPE